MSHTLHRHTIHHRHHGWDNGIAAVTRIAPGETLEFDVADASGTLLLDVAQRRWSDEVVSTLELDPAKLSNSSVAVSVDPTSVRTDYSGDFKATQKDSPYKGFDEQIARDPTFPYLRRRGAIALIGLCSGLPTGPLMATGRLGAAQLHRAELFEIARQRGLGDVDAFVGQQRDQFGLAAHRRR